jgi:hypothetical protein
MILIKNQCFFKFENKFRFCFRFYLVMEFNKYLYDYFSEHDVF